MRTCALLLALLSCTPDHTTQIPVPEQNEAGVVALAIEHTTQQSDAVFDMHALNGNDETVASVHVRTGNVADVADQLPGEGDRGGSEIVFTSAHGETRLLTRERERLEMLPPSDATIAELVALPSIRKTLEREAKLFIQQPKLANGDTAYATALCPTSELLSSPVAKQCCFQDSLMTRFINPASQFVTRQKSTYGICKASDGGSCAGSNCYYGPYGYSRATITGSGYTEMKVYVVLTMFSVCSPDYGYPGGFADVSGTGGLACGCACNGNGTRCYDSSKSGDCPGAPNCNTVGCPGGGSGAGEWNY